jgi:replication factor C subunit 1
MKSRMSSVSKDANLRLDAFSAAPRMFSEAKTTSLDARMELFFVDYDMIPLLVQQAYPNVIEKSTGPDVVKMNRCARAAEAISDCDIYTEYVRNRQAWGLLPSVAAGNVRATGWAAGPPPFLMFPTFLGKNSSRNKKARLLAELDLHMAAHVSGSRDAIRLDYFEPLQQTLFKPLMGEPAKADPVKAATAAIELLDAYGLSKARFHVSPLRCSMCLV